MGCSVSRQQLEAVVAEEVTGSLFLDGSNKPGRRSNKPRRPSSHHPEKPKPRRPSQHAEKPKNEPAIIIPVSSETSGELGQSDDIDQSGETEEEASEEGESTEEAAEEQETALVSLSWTKTACCGTQCQISASKYCCEHDLTRPVACYCQACRERYQEWQEANQAFEDMLQELEQTQQTSSGSCGSPSDSSSSTGNQSGDSGGLDGSSELLSFEGDANYQSHTDTRTSTEQESPPEDGSVYSVEPNLETQTGRYEVMHSPSRKTMPISPPKTIPSRTPTKAWSTQVRRYLYLSRGPAVSSLSLGESETGSMHSLF